MSNLSGITDALRRKPAVVASAKPEMPAPIAVPLPAPSKSREAGKRNGIDHDRVALYIDRKVLKAARRKAEDEDFPDFSTCVEKLLREYAGT